MKCLLVAGARPNFMKIAPIYRAALKASDVKMTLVHTGQHYDKAMSEGFFDELAIPKPDYNLNVASGTHAQQTARIMERFEPVCRTEQPDVVVVVGDVNSTVACTLVAKKLGVLVAHVEAGLRSFDMDMPEEINRIVTDSICDYFFVTEPSGVRNLLHEGKDPLRIFDVGNVMIDNLLYQSAMLQGKHEYSVSTRELRDRLRRYVFLTLHRPSNVDEPLVLARLMDALNKLSGEIPVVFPAHPRTEARLREFGIELGSGIHVLPPLGFSESLLLWRDAACVFTDSGGLQEETTALGVPCFTLRENTERPVTVNKGTNTLLGNGGTNIITAFRSLDSRPKQATIPTGWDGKAAERIVDVLRGIAQA